MNKLEKTIENDIAGRSAADLKFPQRRRRFEAPQVVSGNSYSRSGTAIIRFAGALCLPKFA
jgi:hypothetical protein